VRFPVSAKSKGKICRTVRRNQAFSTQLVLLAKQQERHQPLASFYHFMPNIESTSIKSIFTCGVAYLIIPK
jgi:hypothetical protein